jgi:TnpA family transposase
MHALRRHVAYGQRQQLPADEDDHRRRALCLELVTNAILAWNARYLTAGLSCASASSLTSSDWSRRTSSRAGLAPSTVNLALAAAVSGSR